MSFQVGDRVIDLTIGEGVVVSDDGPGDYPIAVGFNDGTSSYTENGKRFASRLPTLYHAGTQIIPAPEPKRKPPCPFKPFDRVLVRDREDICWTAALFSHKEEAAYFKYITTNGIRFLCCIPYEGNEHLVGTTHIRQVVFTLCNY
jgi:hypothetical protein